MAVSPLSLLVAQATVAALPEAGDSVTANVRSAVPESPSATRAPATENDAAPSSSATVTGTEPVTDP